MAIDGGHVVAPAFPVVSGPPEPAARRERLLRVRVTQAGLDALDAKARRLDISRSAAVRAALREWTGLTDGSVAPSGEYRTASEADRIRAAHFDVVAASEGEPAWADHRHRRTREPVSSVFVAGRRVERFGCQEPGCEVTFE